MSLLQSKQLITSVTRAIKTGKAPDLTSIVRIAQQGKIINTNQARAITSGLRIADYIEHGQTPRVSDVLTAVTGSGVLSRSEANTLRKVVNIGMASLNPSLNTAPTIISNLKSLKVINNSQAKLLRNSLQILRAKSRGDFSSVAAGAMQIAGLDSQTSRILGHAFDGLLSTTAKAKDEQQYKTSTTSFPKNKTVIGNLTKSDVAKILNAIRTAIGEKYPVSGSRTLFKKIHSRGEYGAYRLTISQLGEIGFISNDVLHWAELSMNKNQEKSGSAERYKTYAEVISERTNADYDVAPFKRESANNIQYFFLYNPIPPSYPCVFRNASDIVTNDKLQDELAFNVMENVYRKLLFARTITPETNKKTLAGLLALGLVENSDSAISYAGGVVKTNADGIITKYWYDIGWNAVADNPKQILTGNAVIGHGERKPTTEVSPKQFLDTSSTLANVVASGNLPRVISSLVHSGIIPKSTGNILNAGLGIAAESIKLKISQIDSAKKQLSASASLTAPAKSALGRVSKISSALESMSSPVKSLDSATREVTGYPLSALNAVGDSVSSALASPNLGSVSSELNNLKSPEAISKKIVSLSNEVEQMTYDACGTAVGSMEASGEVSPESISFIGESLKGGMGLASDPNAAVVNELNRRGMCPPGATALLSASIAGESDPKRIADKLSNTAASLGNVGSAIPSLNMKMIENTGAQKGMLDAFAQAKSSALVAVGADKAQILSKPGTASLVSLKNSATSAAASLISTKVGGSTKNLGSDLTSLTTSAKDAVAAASALGASAIGQVSGSAASTAGILGKSVAGNAQGALQNAAGLVDPSLAAAANDVSSALATALPGGTDAASETGKVISSYLPVSPANIPELPSTGTNSAKALPVLPGSKIAAISGGEPSTPPTDPNPIEKTFGAVKVSYLWQASGGVAYASVKGVNISAVANIDKTDINTPSYKLFLAAIDGAIKQERLANNPNLKAVYTKDKVIGDYSIVYQLKNGVYSFSFNSNSENATVTNNVSVNDIVDETRAYISGLNSDKRLDGILSEINRNGFSTFNQFKLDSETPGEDTAISKDLATARDSISGDWKSNLEKVKKTFSNNTPVASQEPSKANADGSTTTTVVEKYGDGSKITTTIVENQQGFVTVSKDVQRVAPAIVGDIQTLNTVNPDAVNHPSNDDTPINTNGAPANADKLPSNEKVLPIQQQSATSGFKDPGGQYPKPSYATKPDVNVLAVGSNSQDIQKSPTNNTHDTLGKASSPAAKTATKKRDVPKAGRHGGTWSQPDSPYAAKYPYNKVIATESGHVQEWDDTPGAERVHFSHRSGTFDEIGPDGTKVTRIVGDGYTIVDNDGYVSIEGKATVHVGGECNIIVMGNSNLTMHGKVNMDVHNDFNLNVAGALSIAAGKGIFMRNEGVFSLENRGNIEVHTPSDFNTNVDGTINHIAASGYRVTTKGDHHTKVAGQTYLTSVGNVNTSTDGDALLKAAKTINTKSGTHTNIESLGNTNVKSAGSLNTESIASTNVKSENVINVEGTDSINIKSANAVNVKSAAATNVKSGAAVNVEGVGNINLKAPEVASSKFSAPTIDVSTLNAGTTNLKGTDPQGGQVTPIAGTASPTAAGSAGDAIGANAADPASEPELAVVAEQAITIPVDKPVSISAASISEGISGGQSSGRGGGQSSGGSSGSNAHDGASPGMMNDGGDISDSGGAVMSDPGCMNNSNRGGNNNYPGADSNYTPGEEAGPFNQRPSIKPTNVDLHGGTLPALPTTGDPNSYGNFQISKYYKLKDLIGGNRLTTARYPNGKTYGPFDIIRNLRELAVLCLDPIREAFGPQVVISSCYRNGVPKGGSTTSAHLAGLAADLQFMGCGYSQGRTIQAAEKIAKLGIPHDQIILEYAPARGTHNPWVHVGIYYPPTYQPRYQKFTMYNDSTVRSGVSANMQGFVQLPGLRA